jgi:hypothetical protein
MPVAAAGWVSAPAGGACVVTGAEVAAGCWAHAASSAKIITIELSWKINCLALIDISSPYEPRLDWVEPINRLRNGDKSWLATSFFMRVVYTGATGNWDEPRFRALLDSCPYWIHLSQGLL